MSTKHTPGPWHVTAATYVTPGANRCVANCAPADCGISYGEAQANARLIAAAPELLAQLFAARNFIRAVMQGESFSRSYYERRVAGADAAIAKAGQS